MKRQVLPVVIVCLLLAACGAPATATLPAPRSSPTTAATETPLPPTLTPASSPTATAAQPASDISPEARAYLDAALDLMQAHSIHRDQIEWEALRARTYRRAYGAQMTADTYQAIRYALADLGDNHSFLMTPEQVAQMEDGSTMATLPEPSGKLIEGGLGYISLPAWIGTGVAVDEHATYIQQIIRDLDTEAPCGWIVDLRENMGGNMWPMLAGIGPILGEGLTGTFVAPDGSETPWIYADGQASEDDAVQAAVSGPAYTLARPLPPVAVLTGPTTSSSGEAIVVAFRGRPDTRSFGQPTSGLSTANQEFVLSDGAWLLLTVSKFADRTGQVYGSKIVPDEITDLPRSTDDPTLQAAVDWLLGRPACSTDK